MNERSNLYQTLFVAETATQEEIRKAYFLLAKKFHDDLNRSAGDDERAFFENALKEINAAYEVLSRPERRAEYDGAHQPSEPAPAPPPPPRAPSPIISPPRVDLGLLTPGDTREVVFRVSNGGGPARQTEVVLSDERLLQVQTGMDGPFLVINTQVSIPAEAEPQELSLRVTVEMDGVAAAGWIMVSVRDRRPKAVPANVDFGQLAPGQKQELGFLLELPDGPSGVQIRNGQGPWYRVVGMDNQAKPYVFVEACVSEEMMPGDYQESIAIDYHGARIWIPIRVQVVENSGRAADEPIPVHAQWTCPRCGGSNFLEDRECRRCGQERMGVKPRRAELAKAHCGYCGYDNPPGSSFCLRCEQPLAQDKLRCPYCGTHLSASAGNCPGCGRFVTLW